MDDERGRDRAAQHHKADECPRKHAGICAEIGRAGSFGKTRTPAHDLS
jgi:hypothetical protein